MIYALFDFLPLWVLSRDRSAASFDLRGEKDVRCIKQRYPDFFSIAAPISSYGLQADSSDLVIKNDQPDDHFFAAGGMMSWQSLLPILCAGTRHDVVLHIPCHHYSGQYFAGRECTYR